MQEEMKKGRGGARQGAGRKKTSTKTIGIRIPGDVERILDGVEGSRTDFIIAAIRAYAANGPER